MEFCFFVFIYLGNHILPTSKTNYLDILAYLKTLISVMSVSFTDTRCIFSLVNFWGIYFARIFSGFVKIYTLYNIHTYILVYIQVLIKS